MRRLTPIERVMWTLGERVPVAVAVTARVPGLSDPEVLRKAIADVRRRHPMLGLAVARGRAGTWDGPELPLRVGTGGWVTEVEAELRRPFQDGPLTRFVLAGDVLAVVCHHVVGDGLGLAGVLRDVLTGAGPEPVPAPPLDRLVAAMDRPRAGRFRQGGSKWPVRADPAPAFALVPHSLPAGLSAALQERCRAERTSVHAALSIAGLRALAEADGVTRRQLFSPVNLRGLLPGLPEGACGQYAIELYTWVETAAGQDFWTAARDLRAALRRQTDPGRLLRQVRLLRLLNPLPDPALGALLARSAKPPGSFTFTNLGRVPFDGATELHCAVHMGTLGSGLLAAVTAGGRIHLSVSTVEARRDAAAGFLTAVARQLDV